MTQNEHSATQQKKDAQIIKNPEIPRAVASVDEMIASFREYLLIKEKLKAEGDIVEIKGREFAKKSFIEKLMKFFGISTRPVRVREKINKETGEVVYFVWVKAEAKGGRFSIAGAAASSSERNFSRIPHDIYTLAEVRATKRAVESLLGFGSIPEIKEEE